MKLKSILVGAALALCAGVGLRAFAASNPMDAVDAVTPGEWCSNFTAAKAYADEKNVPMLIFWANPGCSQCAKLESACKSDDFKAWMKETQMIFVFGYGTGSADAKACKEFVKNSTKEFPYMGVYWKSNTAGEEVLQRFTGRSGKMLGVSKSLGLDEQLMTAASLCLLDWDPDGGDPEPEPEPEVIRVGGDFVVPDVEGSRLEAIAGVTQSVEVPLARTNASCVVTNVLTVGGVAQNVIWGLNQLEKAIRVDTSAIEVGGTIDLTLMLDGVEVSKSAIHGVAEEENSPKNPKFLGEDFGYGEWTFDYEAAKKMAAANSGAKLLVMFSGPLWCPYCIGIEDSLLNKESFHQWAKDNQVILVLMEQGRASSPATALGLRGPRLTTYDHDPNKLKSGVYVSGAAYRSRKGVTEAQATMLINQAAEYTAKWLEPGSSAARCGNPTILLINPETEGICARFNGYNERVGSSIVYDEEENLARLDALLTKNGQTAVNRYPQTTTLTHQIGATTEFSLDVNEASVSYQIAPRAGATDIALTTGTENVYMFTVYKDFESVATGTNGVSFVATSSDVRSSYTIMITKSFAKGERSAAASFASAFRPLDTDNEFVKQAFKTEAALAVDGAIAGTVNISNTKKGKVTVKYFNASTRKTVSLSGYWSEPDELGTSFFEAAKYSGDVTCQLELAADGEVSVVVKDTRTDASAAEMTGLANAAEIDYAQYAGYYTVALPVLKSEQAQTFGAGYAIIKANTTTAKKYGKVSCKILLPNGTSKTVTGQLMAGEAGFANLTLTMKSGAEVLILPFSIRPNSDLAPTHRAVVSQTGCSATWIGTNKKNPFSVSLGVYGSRYDKKESLVDCCGTSELVLTFDAGDDDIASILGNGLVFSLTEKKIVAEEKISGFSLSFAQSSGLVNGKTRIQLKDGSRAISAKLKGILFLDWYDCGCFDDDEVVPLDESLAHLYGTCYYTTKVNGKSVTRSLHFSLKAKE